MVCHLLHYAIEGQSCFLLAQAMHIDLVIFWSTIRTTLTSQAEGGLYSVLPQLEIEIPFLSSQISLDFD